MAVQQHQRMMTLFESTTSMLSLQQQQHKEEEEEKERKAQILRKLSSDKLTTTLKKNESQDEKQSRRGDIDEDYKTMHFHTELDPDRESEREDDSLLHNGNGTPSLNNIRSHLQQSKSTENLRNITTTTPSTTPPLQISDTTTTSPDMHHYQHHHHHQHPQILQQPQSLRLPRVQNLQGANLKKSLLSNTSGTNLNVYLRGHRRHSMSNPINELLTSPKLKNGVSPATPDNKLFKNGTSTSTTPANVPKNRLVDQFYNTGRITSSTNSKLDLPSLYKDSVSKSPSHQQLLPPAPPATPFANSGTLTPPKQGTPSSERNNFHWKNGGGTTDELIEESIDKNDGEINDTIIENILNNGGFQFNYDHNQIIEDDDLVNYLLNIDSVIDHRNDKSTKKPFEQLDKIMTNLSDKALLKSRQILFNKNLFSAPVDSLTELNNLDDYLVNMKKNVDELAETLRKNMFSITMGYKDEIHDNVQRLNKVSEELKLLEKKSNMFKEKINEQKSINFRKMMDSLDILDDVNKRMNDYCKVKKSRLIMKINIFLAIVILGMSIYYGTKLIKN